MDMVVARPIEEHLEHNNLNDIYQSTYGRGHSTEIALLKVHSDITEAIDEGSMTAIIMLDLSEFSFGIKEKALTWIKSYLNDGTQCILVTNKTSPEVGILFGVSQRSVLGSKNYCMYTKPFGEIIKRQSIKYHCYAYDIQLYMTLKTCNTWDDILYLN